MSDRDRGPSADWVDTTAGGEPDPAGEAPGTGSVGSPPANAPGSDVEDVRTGAGVAATIDSDDANGGDAGTPEGRDSA